MAPDKECAEDEKEIEILQKEIKRLSKIEPEINHVNKLWMESELLNSTEKKSIII